VALISATTTPQFTLLWTNEQTNEQTWLMAGGGGGVDRWWVWLWKVKKWWGLLCSLLFLTFKIKNKQNIDNTNRETYIGKIYFTYPTSMYI
jgi:hypothetical protein